MSEPETTAREDRIEWLTVRLDIDADGVVTVRDQQKFLRDFARASIIADVNGDETIDASDYYTYRAWLIEFGDASPQRSP